MRDSAGAAEVSRPLSLAALFLVFLKAGCAFGGGLGILAELEDELVRRRRVIDRDELLTIYGIGRIVPSGTMTAVTVALGRKFGGQPGILIALAGLILPGFLATVTLTVAYHLIEEGGYLETIRATLLPGALALIAVAAVRLGRNVFRSVPDVALAAAGLAGTLFADINPALLLIAGGLVSAVLLAGEAKR
jgi:chromate transporter